MKISYLASALIGAAVSGVAFYGSLLFMREHDFESFVDRLRLDRSTIFNQDSYEHTLSESDSLH